MNKIFLAAVFLALALAVPGEDATPEELVKRLGDANYEVRHQAGLDLLELGKGARGEVRKALSSPDPEVRERARELWKSMQWMVFPKAGKDISPAISKLENKNTDRETWESLYSTYGDDLIYLLVEMRADPKYSDLSVRGFSLLLEKSEPAALASEIGGCRDAAAKESILGYLKSSRPENLNSELCMKMLQVLKQLKLYEDALRFGVAASKTWKRENLMFETAEIARLGHLEKKIWENCAREILDEKDAVSKESIAFFYITMAAIMSEPERVKAIIDAMDCKFEDKSVLRKLCDVLIRSSMYEEILKVTEARNEPVFSYARSVALAESGRKDEGGELWKTILSGLKSETECYELAEFMDEAHDARVEKIWERILEIDADGKLTVYDVNASLKLAPYHEKRGELGKAADLYEKSLKGSKDIGAFIVMTNSAGKAISNDEVLKCLEDKVEELRKKEADSGK